MTDLKVSVTLTKCCTVYLEGKIKHAIEGKLQAALASTISQECHVLYILVECRKLLDVDGNAGHQELRTYCNWAAHDCLTRRSAETEKILTAFDASVGSGGSKATDFVSMTNFRNELKKFFEAYNLPTNLTDSDSDWIAFLKIYAEIIADCPIEYSAAKSALSHVEKVILKGTTPPKWWHPSIIQSRKQYRINLHWEIHLKNGRVVPHEFIG